MSCSSDTAVTTNFAATVGTETFYCILKEKRVLSMVKAFFLNRPELIGQPRLAIEASIKAKFEGVEIFTPITYPSGIEFESI
jgi:hypothetical protein